MKFLLDTDVAAALIAGQIKRSLPQVRSCADNEVGLSSVTVMQLSQGLLKLDAESISPDNKAVIRHRTELLLTVLPVIAFDGAAAKEAAKLKCRSVTAGVSLTDMAACIAGQAVSGRLTLITMNRNALEDLGYPGLKCVGWC